MSAAATVASHVLCPHCGKTNRVPQDRPAAQAKCGACHRPLFAGAALPVDEAGLRRHVSGDDIPVLVDLWAPWCGPCRAMAPMYERAAQLLEPEVRLLKLNIDEAPATARELRVQGIPALALFRGGRLLAMSAGARDATQIVQWVRGQLAA